MAAGAEAGLNVLNIINEPTAAVLAYATKHKVNGTVMVYDLGGGTFDVTIAKVEGTGVQCLTSEGDSDLGGTDFDYKLAEIIDQKYKEKNGRSIREVLGLTSPEGEKNSDAWQTLLHEAEEIKKSLSKLDTKKVTFGAADLAYLQCQVSKSEFEDAIRGLVARTVMRVETAMDNLDMTPDDIDVVLLVGGSTRVPLVMETIKKIMGKEGSQEVDPDEAVALGASIYAGLKSSPEKLKPMQREALSGVQVTDVANHHFGTIALNYNEDSGLVEERVTVILKKDSPLPCSNTDTFHTAHDGQEWIGFKLTQSAEEELDPRFVNIPFEKRMGPLPSGRPEGQAIVFKYTYDVNQIMWIELRDVSSGLVFKETYQVSDVESTPVSIPTFTID